MYLTYQLILSTGEGFIRQIKGIRFLINLFMLPVYVTHNYLEKISYDCGKVQNGRAVP
jgi:deoxyribodipyrimidine photolyase-like uncharacterized protein